MLIGFCALAAAAQAADWAGWLDAAASYLITEEERRAFQELTNDADREMFVERFWLRRDPTPDTLENEVRVEHDRRVAEAERRFGGPLDGLRPGMTEGAGKVTLRLEDWLSNGPSLENGISGSVLQEEIPVSIDITYSHLKPEIALARITAAVENRHLRFAYHASGGEAQAAVLGRILQPDGHAVETFFGCEQSPDPRGVTRIARSVVVRPGPHLLRIAVKDAVSGALGSRAIPLSVPRAPSE